MACKRNCIIEELVNYIESLGVIVNIGKTKARGNKGIFCTKNGCYRIDIAKVANDENMLSTLLHEFAHYIHYKYDSSLTSLDFVFGGLSEIEKEELINITVKKVPKDFAASLYKAKEELEIQNKQYINILKAAYPEFKVSEPFRKLERSFFGFNLSELQLSYFQLKSNQKNITKINAKINKMNKYYNQPSELWARFFELYYTDKNTTQSIAPNLTEKFMNSNLTEITQVKKILQIF